MRTVIKAAVYDSNVSTAGSAPLIYKSLVTEDDDQNIVSGIVTDAVYDEEAEEVVVLYRNLGVKGLTKDHTLADMSRNSSLLA